MAAFGYLPTDDEKWRSALDAQFDLAQSGRHRSVGIADLLTAVLAQAHELTILQYDSDFDTAAMVLSFQHGWVAPPGTL
jgi:predicted nucleic acid-binding protein